MLKFWRIRECICIWQVVIARIVKCEITYLIAIIEAGITMDKFIEQEGNLNTRRKLLAQVAYHLSLANNHNYYIFLYINRHCFP